MISISTTKIKNLNEVLRIEYKSIKKQDSSIRDRFKSYSTRIRGSVRFSRSQFYTNEEFNERVKRSLEITLP